MGVALLSFIIFSIAYIPLYLLLHDGGLFTFLGTWVGWLLAAWLVYLLILIAFAIISWLKSGRQFTGDEVRFGLFIPSHWIRRTGIARTDWLIFALSLVLSLLWLTSSFWFPWAFLAAVLFGLSSLLVPVEIWPVHPRRDIPEPVPLPPVPSSEDTVTRTWNWRCRARPFDASVSVQIRVKAAESRSNGNPSRQGPFSSTNLGGRVRQIVEEGAKDREPAEAARQLLAFARNNRFNYFEEAQNTLQFAQIIPYAFDDATKGMEYFRYAIETLLDNAGDCDCKAILAATLFRLMGLRSVLLISSDEQHAAVAVEGAPDFPGNRYFEWKGSRYYFCETTDGSFSFTVGEVPPSVDLNTYTERIEIDPALLSGSGSLN
jgi:hypothetical protein